VTVGLKHTKGNEELGSAVRQTHTFSTDGTNVAIELNVYNIDVSLFLNNYNKKIPNIMYA
jgi:hypothetical protein